MQWVDPPAFHPVRFIWLCCSLGGLKLIGLFTGPPKIPLFGSYLFMLIINFKYLHKAALTLSRWYKSDIIGLHVGPFPVAVVHSADGVREILNNQVFDGRPQLFVAAMRDPGQDVRGESNRIVQRLWTLVMALLK